MAKLSSSSSSSSSSSPSSSRGKRKMIKLNSLAERLQKISQSLSRPGKYSASVPEDVKEGHFAVTASMDGTRFVMPLECLSHPTFRKLLQMAADEYGFDHQGALTLPCSAAVLNQILDDSSSISWSTSAVMVQSY